MVDSLTVQGIEFPLRRGPDGVKVESASVFFSGAAELVNQGVAGTFGYRDWIDRLDSDLIELPAFSYIRTLPANEAPKEAADAWAERTGRPLPNEIRHVHLDHGFLVPAESWVPSSFLSELYQRVRHERLDPEKVWLFRVPALFWKPKSGERSLLEPLDRVACQTSNSDVSALVPELQTIGLFDVVFASERAEALREWKMLRLLDLQTAGLALVDYLYSPENRAVGTPPEFFRAVEDSPVSLAVFACEDTPWPATGRFEWLAGLLRAVDRGAPTPGFTVRQSLLNGTPRIEAISRLNA